MDYYNLLEDHFGSVLKIIWCKRHQQAVEFTFPHSALKKSENVGNKESSRIFQIKNYLNFGQFVSNTF